MNTLATRKLTSLVIVLWVNAWYVYCFDVRNIRSKHQLRTTFHTLHTPVTLPTHTNAVLN